MCVVGRAVGVESLPCAWRVSPLQNSPVTSAGPTPPSQAEKKSVIRAVKMLKGECTPDAKKEFLKEADIMLNFDHINVTTIQGVCVQQAPWLYVLEYCM